MCCFAHLSKHKKFTFVEDAQNTHNDTTSLVGGNNLHLIVLEPGSWSLIPIIDVAGAVGVLFTLPVDSSLLFRGSA